MQHCNMYENSDSGSKRTGDGTPSMRMRDMVGSKRDETGEKTGGS